jgi:hypothetical protein
MKTSKTIYQFVLDQSGSMSNARPQTVDLFNSQLKTLREAQEMHPEQHFYAALTVFDTEVYHTIGFSVVQGMPSLNLADYQPSGGTAMYDAIGDSIARIQTFFAPELKSKEASVVVVILTDGMENSSRRHTASAISSQVKELEQSGSWSFTMLGADFDVHQLAEGLNLKQSSTKQYSKRDFFEMQQDLSFSILSYAQEKKAGKESIEFLKSDKK